MFIMQNQNAINCGYISVLCKFDMTKILDEKITSTSKSIQLFSRKKKRCTAFQNDFVY